MHKNVNWSELNNLQLGKYSEYYAKMEFIAYGYDVFTSEVDDHGVDFVTKRRDSKEFFEVQVKSICKSNYVFIPKVKKDKKDGQLKSTVADEKHFWVCLLRYKNSDKGSKGKKDDDKGDNEPQIYVIPLTEWYKKENKDILVIREYGDGRKSKPEWGINFSNQNEAFFEKFKIENMLKCKGE